MTPLESTIEALMTQAGSGRGLAQAAIVAAGLGAGWLAGGALRRRVDAKGRWAFGKGGFDRVAFPLAALGIIWGARFLARKWIPTPFIDLAITLLVAFAVIRFAVYVLRKVLPEGALLRGSERTIAIAMWLGVALHLTGILPEVWEALDSVSFMAGKQRISLLLVAQGLASVAVALAISMWLANLIEGQILAAERIEVSTRVVLAKLVRAVASAAPSAWAWASGCRRSPIILLDRSVRIGDLVTVDTRHGVVKEIASRYTVIRSLDGTESIIPNETLITQAVTNHSYTDRKVAVKVKVSVGYGSDVDRVFALLLDIARRQPRVLADPAPGCFIVNLGDNGIDIELGAWIADPDQGQAALRGAILKEALETFRAEGIEIPFPQREVRLLGSRGGVG